MGATRSRRETGFGTGAARYASSRPGYPDEVVDAVLTHLDLRCGDRVVEVGAGSGAFTGALLAAGLQVVAVEPVAAMREQLATRHPTADVRDGTAEDLPLGDGEIDGYVAAQAFHWFDAQRALAAFDRVVVPGGRAALVFNHRDIRPAWMAAWDELVEGAREGGPSASSETWRTALDTAALVEEVTRLVVDNPHPQPRAAVIDRFRSSSAVASQPPERQAELVAAFEAILERDPELAGAEEITVPYRTELLVLARGPAA